jgi:hypothetical protein
MVAGILMDLAYGFALAGLFVLLFDSLPGTGGLIKGLSFAAVLWFRTVSRSPTVVLVAQHDGGGASARQPLIAPTITPFTKYRCRNG